MVLYIYKNRACIEKGTSVLDSQDMHRGRQAAAGGGTGTKDRAALGCLSRYKTVQLLESFRAQERGEGEGEGEREGEGGRNGKEREGGRGIEVRRVGRRRE